MIISYWKSELILLWYSEGSVIHVLQVMGDKELFKLYDGEKVNTVIHLQDLGILRKRYVRGRA